MRTLAEIIEIIKGYKDFKEDAEVARFLNIKPKTLAASKSRNSIPYGELITFCNQENISINWLLAGVEPRTLQREAGQVEPPDPKLAKLTKMLDFILKEGTIEDRGRVRGIIEEVYDDTKKVTLKKELGTEAGQKKGA